jgi:hypothetical protein
MKKILTVVAATLCAVTLSYAQGTVNFNTSVAGAGAKVLEAEGFAGAGTGLGNTAAGMVPGTQFLMQLYAANGNVSDSSSLVPVGNPVNSRGGTANNGYSQNTGTTTLGWAVDPLTTIALINPAGGSVTLQLRAWWAGPTGTEFETYYENGLGLMRFGASPLLFLPVTGNPVAVPPSTAVTLAGLQGFQLVPVPEPSTFALLGLGALGLALLRRK